MYLVVWALLMVIAFAEAKNSQWERQCSFLAATILALFAGLRYKIGSDWAGYSLYFESVGSLQELVCGDRLPAKFEPLYLALNYVVKSLGGNMALIYMLIACFNMFTLHWVLGRLNSLRMPIWLVYFGVAFVLGQFTLLRQSIAISFVLIAYLFTVQGRLWNSAFMILAGTGFQITTLMYTPPMLLRRYLLPLRWAFALLAVCAIPAVFGWNLYVIAIKFLAPHVPQWLSYKFAFALYQPTAPISLGALGLIIFHAAVLCVFYLKATEEEKRDVVLRIAVWSTLFLLVAHLALFAVPSFWNRLMLVALPWELAALSRLTFVREVYFRLQAPATMAVGILALGALSVALSRPNTMTLVPYQSIVQVMIWGDTGESEKRFAKSLVNAQEAAAKASSEDKEVRREFFEKYVSDGKGDERAVVNQPLTDFISKQPTSTSEQQAVPDCLAKYRFWE